jgi:pyruvate,water dikinase
VPVAPADRTSFAVSEEDILTLARWAVRIEEHYSMRRGKTTPMDIEWAKDGITGEIFIRPARPETVQSRKNVDVMETLS